MANPIEMGMSDVEEAMNRVRDIPGYRPYFDKAFPGSKDPMTVDNAAKAVAAYERTLITPDSAYDLYVKGDKQAMTEQQVRGMQAFDSSGCTACHSGAAFNGPAMAPGTGFFMKFPTFTDNDYVKKYSLHRRRWPLRSYRQGSGSRHVEGADAAQYRADGAVLPQRYGQDAGARPCA